MNNQISTIAKTYAKGIIEYTSGDIYRTEEILYKLQNIQTALKESQELMELLKNPAVDFAKKIEIINEIFNTELGDAEKNILKILIEKQRFNEFEYIIKALSLNLQDLKGEKEVLIISAVMLDEYEKSQILSKLQSKLNKKINAKWIENSEILGGIIIQIDDNIIDMSLLNKITNLSKNIIK